MWITRTEDKPFCKSMDGGFGINFICRERKYREKVSISVRTVSISVLPWRTWFHSNKWPTGRRQIALENYCTGGVVCFALATKSHPEHRLQLESLSKFYNNLRSFSKICLLQAKSGNLNSNVVGITTPASFKSLMVTQIAALSPGMHFTIFRDKGGSPSFQLTFSTITVNPRKLLWNIRLSFHFWQIQTGQWFHSITQILLG